MKNKIISFIALILIFSFSSLQAEDIHLSHKQILQQGLPFKTTGVLVKEENQILLKTEKHNYILIFSQNQSKTMARELLEKRELQVEGVVVMQEKKIAVTQIKFNDRMIIYDSEKAKATKSYDLFRDYDGDGICDKRNNKLFFADNIMQKFKSYHTIFGEHDNLKSSGTNSKQTGSQEGDSGQHGGGQGGGK